MGIDLSTQKIQQLFYESIKELTLETTFDVQFSDGYQRFDKSIEV